MTIADDLYEALERLKDVLSMWINTYTTTLAHGAKYDEEFEADIEALSVVIQALEKQIPKKPLYEPICKFGYADCICDPAYIKYVDPEWYTELYGEVAPSEVDDCYDCDNGSRYDDEDK